MRLRTFAGAGLLALVLIASGSAEARHHAARHAAHDARPRAWCGWYMRHHVGRDPGEEFNLARAWARWGAAAAGPAIGVIVVWAHHVGQIVDRKPDGRWVVHSGNDGHAVRTRPRPLAGAIAFRQG